MLSRIPSIEATSSVGIARPVAEHDGLALAHGQLAERREDRRPLVGPPELVRRGSVGDLADHLAARLRPSLRTEPHRRLEHVASRVILVVDLAPVRPQPGEGLGRDVLGGGGVERHEGAGAHHAREVLAVEALEARSVRHHPVLSLEGSERVRRLAYTSMCMSVYPCTMPRMLQHERGDR